MTIGLGDVQNILENEFFLSKRNKAFHFLPAELCDWALLSNLQVSQSDIAKWEAFAYGEIEFYENDFQDLMFSGDYSPATEVLFISDDSLIKKMAFSFKLGDFEKFINHYEKIFKMNLFQPEDFMVYLREYKEMRIIHHDGKLIKIRGEKVIR